MTEYREAPEDILELVEKYAKKFHPHLRGRKIAVLMKDKATQSHGKTVLGSAALLSPKMKPLLQEEYDFVLCFPFDVWNSNDQKTKEAIVDHELTHCAIDTDGTPYIRPHDYEEFAVIVERHGFWRNDGGELAIQQTFGLKINEKAPVKVGTLVETR